MGGFYLDVLKDRLYTSAAASPERRSAQTVLYRIADAMIRLLVPFTTFTADEAWALLPGDREPSAQLAAWPEPSVVGAWTDAGEIEARWARLLAAREEVAKALEEARAAKLIGSGLEARVTLTASGELLELLQRYGPVMPTILIVSQVEIVAAEGKPAEGAAGAEGVSTSGLKVEVAPARGSKCIRCWNFSEELGATAGHPDICPRCATAILNP
jgi:isoleucyl-tRNA synthetase